MSKVFFVSALFNIDREDGRKCAEYIKWFETTLKIRVPMVFFTEDLVDFEKDKRGELSTEIILQDVEEIHYYRKDQIQEILDAG